MMRRYRFFSLATATLGGVASALVSLAACSSDEPARAFIANEDAAPEATANLPDSGPPVETDAAADAREPFDGSDEVVTCTANPCVTQITAGDNHFCALLSDHTVHCWGQAFLAFGNVDAGTPPVFAPRSMGLSNVMQVASGEDTNCARHDDGTVQCWGSNYGGAIPTEPPWEDSVPHDPTTAKITGVVHVAVAMRGAVFAVKETGELWAWGGNDSDQLARGKETGVYLGPGLTDFSAGCTPGTRGCPKVVRAGGASMPQSAEGSVAFAIGDDGQLYTWGSSTEMVAYPGPIPVSVAGLSNVGSASATLTHICAVADGHLYCWGRDGQAACTGVADAARSPVEIRTKGDARPQQVGVSYFRTCVRMDDGTVQCCGADDKGQSGTGDTDAEAPLSSRGMVETKGLAGRVVSVAVGQSTTCALIQGGTVQCWGSNSFGELGQGTADEQRHPVPVTVHFD
ncbi:hypothetical protein AKJ09_01519 [Labilithrix luteola]|uniref:BNR repeat domain protein n=1 Tax=Labilithrix luteola TaxID=1391654 RepID=A0A0K1PMT9_9BACT|nr:hypothetical protein [Labilithrix luteola]AKU94855.1 hypothetical protein AKJ09_01519 [Labilithrix luteola]